MPGLQPGFIYITVSGLGGFEQRIRNIATFGANIQSLREPFTQIGEDYLDDFAMNFATKGELFGGWAPLKPSTIAERERLGFGSGPPLWRTGRLRNSLAVKGDPDNIFIVTDNSLTVGTRVPYAAPHQTGSQDPPGHPPKRVLVATTRARREGIVRTIGDWVRRKVAESGLGG